jgi:hypothetical protein
MLVLALLLAIAIPVLAAADTQAALDYVATQQNPDGGFGSGFSPDSSAASTADAVLAIAAVNGDIGAFDQGGNTPMTYLAAAAPSITTGGDLAKVIMAAIAVGENPRALGGVDAVSKLESMTGPDGRIGGDMDTFFAHLLAVTALVSAQRPVPPEAIALIVDGQQETGAWAWDGTDATAADTNTTALAVQALVAAGEPASGDAVAGAMDYYRSIQNDDGGWPYQNPSDFGTDTDANSTAVTIQALTAAGFDPASAEWSKDGASPMTALEAFQNPSGAFAWQAAMPDDNLLATIQALPAIAGKAFPFATMDVGEATAGAPATVPATGGAGLGLLLPLLAGGAVLAGAGYGLLRRNG